MSYDYLLQPIGDAAGLNAGWSNLVPQGSVFQAARDWRTPGFNSAWANTANAGWDTLSAFQNNRAYYANNPSVNPSLTPLAMEWYDRDRPITDAYNQFYQDVDAKVNDLTSWLGDNAATVQAKVSRNLASVPFGSPAAKSRITQEVFDAMSDATAWDPYTLFNQRPALTFPAGLPQGSETFFVPKHIDPYFLDYEDSIQQANADIQGGMDAVQAFAAHDARAVPIIAGGAAAPGPALPDFSADTLSNLYGRFTSQAFLDSLRQKFGEKSAFGQSAPAPSLFYAGTPKGANSVENIDDENL